jgi:hypothetical protein
VICCWFCAVHAKSGDAGSHDSLMGDRIGSSVHAHGLGREPKAMRYCWFSHAFCEAVANI